MCPLFLVACLHEACWNVNVLEASALLSSSDRNWQICSNGGRRLPWPELQNSLKEEVLQIIALFGGSIQSYMNSERMCHGQVTTQYTGKYPELCCCRDQSGSSGSSMARLQPAVCGDLSALADSSFAAQENLAVVKQFTLL